MTPTISLKGVGRHYRDQLALADITFDIDGASITGLLGRNGAGKTTLLRVIAAQEFASAGQVRVLGSSPVESNGTLRRMVLVREDQSYPALRVGQILQVAAWFHPNWDAQFAKGLAARFELPPDRRVRHLSRGQQSALGIVVGLAARAQVTLFDEPYAGLDARARQVFYDSLLADFSEHPRAVLVSTHLIDEVADLLERVLVIDQGRIVLDAAVDDVRGFATMVSGAPAAVDAFVAGRRTAERRHGASQESVVVLEPLADHDRLRARQLNLSLAPCSLQRLVMHSANWSAQARADGVRP